MNSSVKLILVPVFAAIIMATGIATALAQSSQVGGNLSSSPSYADGGMVATVADATTTPTVAQAENDSTTGDRVSRSGSRRSAPYGGVTFAQASDPIIIIDGGSIASSGELGTGGGFDPDAELAIAGANSGGSDGGLSPSDAVAFNNSQNPLLANSDLIAATGDSAGTAKVWTAVVLGLALLGLAGYAVNALMAYRRENDL